MIRCGNCVYFQNNSNTNKDNDLSKQGGTCHRYPPQVYQDGSRFPGVNGANFCGEGVEGVCPFERPAPQGAVIGHASTVARGNSR